MTNEDAIDHLKFIIDAEGISFFYHPKDGKDQFSLSGLKQACRAAIYALRAQPAKPDRNQWKGCFWCKQYGSVPLRGFTEHGSTSITVKYCPNCGKPLTEEALAEMVDLFKVFPSHPSDI